MLSRLVTAFKALHQLGYSYVLLYSRYQLGLRLGWYRKQPGIESSPRAGSSRQLALPAREALLAAAGAGGLERLLAEAGEVAAGQVRLFGGPPVPLRLAPLGPLQHWTACEGGSVPGGNMPGDEVEGKDIKWIWEPGRFGWAYILARAYYLAGDERYAAAFWSYSDIFLAANPPGMGPHWASAQEVALRLLAMVFAGQAFAASPHTTAERAGGLRQAIAAHAARIPPTLVYARAQNNNHLLSEAAGLYTAGMVLPAHPQAERWRQLGWHWFNAGLQAQVAADGAYIQHSTNYHRLALQLGLWMRALAVQQGEVLPAPTLEKLAAAARWLLELADETSGRLPNLGPNDGAYIQPLAACPFHDYRPVLQAASVAFLAARAFPPGPWDEMALWYGLAGEVVGPGKTPGTNDSPPAALQKTAPAILRNTGHPSWAYLRAARFTARPGHADQLHVDLWCRGLNLAQDAGTYLYNAPPPWDNALTRTQVHNTLTVNGQDQMNRAGRFLYLDWAQAEIVEHTRAANGSWEQVTAQHDGYRRLGLLHRRTLEYTGPRWTVSDALLPTRQQVMPVTACLHWLLPDLPWDVSLQGENGCCLCLQTPVGEASLHVRAEGGLPILVRIACAGKLLYGSGAVTPVEGWAAPTYGYKTTALSVGVTVQGVPPLGLSSQWQLE